MQQILQKGDICSSFGIVYLNASFCSHIVCFVKCDKLLLIVVSKKIQWFGLKIFLDSKYHCCLGIYDEAVL